MQVCVSFQCEQTIVVGYFPFSGCGLLLFEGISHDYLMVWAKVITCSP